MPLLLVAVLVAAAVLLLPGFLQRKRGGSAEASPLSFGGQKVGTLDWRNTAPNSALAQKVAEWSAVHGVDERLTAAVIMTESSFNPDAENPADPSYGLMQVTPLIARAFGGWTDAKGVQAIKDPDTNLRAGTGFLQHLLARYGNLESAVEAYNLGETKFDKGLRSPLYRAKVLGYFRDFGGNG